MQPIIVLFLMALPAPSFADQSVPVLLWKSPLNGAALPDIQELSSKEGKSQLHTFLNSMETEVLLLFLMNELNVEDFSGYSDALPRLQREFETSEHVFTPSTPPLQMKGLASYSFVTVNVSDPPSVRLADGNSKTLLLVPLHDRPAADRRATLQQVDISIERILDKVKTLSGSYVALLTGKYTSMGGEVSRPSRKLQAVDAKIQSSHQHLLLNFGCVLLYTSDSPVIHFEAMKETTGPQALLLPLGAPTSNTSNCNGSDVNIITVIWQHANTTSVDLTDVTLKLSFKAKMVRPGGSDLSSWTLENVTLSYAGTVDGKAISKAEVELDFDEVYAPRHFSYHCTSRLWAAEPTGNSTDGDQPMVTALQLPGFQVSSPRNRLHVASGQLNTIHG